MGVYLRDFSAVRKFYFGLFCRLTLRVCIYFSTDAYFVIVGQWSKSPDIVHCINWSYAHFDFVYIA